jgi:deoxyuridine 5'-triphosphate nucleotidohydrolase
VTRLSIAVRRLPHAADLPLPIYATAASAGMDVCAAVDGELILEPGARVAVPTGLCVAVPPGFEAQIRPRSGLALKHGLTVLNSPGTVDSDYRGEIQVILANLGATPFSITRGMRIAQIIVAPIARVEWAESAALPESDRGKGGFGSTGLDPTTRTHG